MLAAVAAVLLPAGLARAEVHGGIEIGAKGIKATVLDIAATPDGFEVAIKLADTTNTRLVAGIARTGSFDPRAVEETATAVARYVNRMKSEFQVDSDRIYVVGSSGLFSPIQDKQERVQQNQQVLAEAVRMAAGASLAFIDDRREAELSIVGILPRQFQDQAVLIDIGSGNTKGGYVGARNEIVTVSVPYGTASFAELVQKAGGSFAEQAATLRDKELAPALKQQLSSRPEVTARPRVYLSGGIVWATATLTHPEETRAFTPLSVKDFDDLEKCLVANPEAFPAPSLSVITDVAKRYLAAVEIQRVRKVYSPEQLLAGVQILKALADGMQFEADHKQLYFARHGYLGWILAYVAEKAAPPK
jgi:hypothetical protein